MGGDPRPEGMCQCFPAAKKDAPKTALGKLAAHCLHEDWFKWTKLQQVLLPSPLLLGVLGPATSLC